MKILAYSYALRDMLQILTHDDNRRWLEPFHREQRTRYEVDVREGGPGEIILSIKLVPKGE